MVHKCQEAKSKSDEKPRSSEDLNRYVEGLRQYAEGKRSRIGDDERLPQPSAAQLCDFLDALVLQWRPKLPKGTVEQLIGSLDKFQIDAADWIGQTEGKKKLLNEMNQAQEINAETYAQRVAQMASQEEQNRRDMAGVITLFFDRMVQASTPKPRGQRKGRLDQVLDELDQHILRLATQRASRTVQTDEGVRSEFTEPEVSREILAVVKAADEAGLLQQRGRNKKRHLEAHTRRNRRKLRALVSDAERQ